MKSQEAKVRKLIKESKSISASIAQERDRLREIIDDLVCISESCDEAVELIDGAVDALSKYL